MPGTDVLADSLAHAAQSLNEVSSTQETLAMIVDVAVRSIPGADHVGISEAHQDGRLDTLAATSTRVREFDELQVELGEGPCLYAIEEHTLVRIDDIADERRWPRFADRAGRLGLGSQIGVRMRGDDRTLSGLNIYAEKPHALTEESAHSADLFATLAAVAMGKARTIDQLYEGMHHRQRIGVAVGILMQRYRLDEQRAFGFLVRASSHANVKLRDVAAEIVAHHTADVAAHGAAERLGHDSGASGN